MKFVFFTLVFQISPLYYHNVDIPLNELGGIRKYCAIKFISLYILIAQSSNYSKTIPKYCNRQMNFCNNNKNSDIHDSREIPYR